MVSSALHHDPICDHRSRYGRPRMNLAEAVRSSNLTHWPQNQRSGLFLPPRWIRAAAQGPPRGGTITGKRPKVTLGLDSKCNQELNDAKEV
jgi:hypothetical protein